MNKPGEPEFFMKLESLAKEVCFVTAGLVAQVATLRILNSCESGDDLLELKLFVIDPARLVRSDRLPRRWR